VIETIPIVLERMERFLAGRGVEDLERYLGVEDLERYLFTIFLPLWRRQVWFLQGSNNIVDGHWPDQALEREHT
jgi:hypothetical protein